MLLDVRYSRTNGSVRGVAGVDDVAEKVTLRVLQPGNAEVLAECPEESFRFVPATSAVPERPKSRRSRDLRDSSSRQLATCFESVGSGRSRAVRSMVGLPVAVACASAGVDLRQFSAVQVIAVVAARSDRITAPRGEYAYRSVRNADVRPPGEKSDGLFLARVVRHGALPNHSAASILP